MRIAVMGAGAIGGYFGARLAAAGESVAFIARGAHLAALRDTGLRVRSPLGDLHLRPVEATDAPAEVDPVDVVLFCVKAQDTDAAARAIAPLMGPETVAISLQNGIDNEARMAAVLGATRVAGGTAYIAASLPEPGLVSHNGPYARLVVGETAGGGSARLQRFAAACAAAGIECQVSQDIRAELWRKFVFLASLSGVTAATRLPLGPVLADPAAAALFADCMAEVAVLANAEGVSLPADVVEKTMAMSRTLPAAMKSSQLQDLEAGKPLELEHLAGYVVALGRARGVPVPVNRALLAVLHPHAMGRR